MQSPERPCIIIDSSPLRYLYTGLGQFTHHLLEELGKQASTDARLVALVHPRYAERVPEGMKWLSANWLRRHSPPFLQPFLYPACQVWHMTTENTRLTGIPTATKLILTIHGLHFLDEAPPQQAARELAHVQSLVDRADVITVVSQFTRNLVRKNLNTGGRSIEVIPNGISHSHAAAHRPSWAPQRKFLFTIGTFFARKNFLALLPMMHHVQEFDLVIAGDANRDYGNAVRAAVSSEELQSRVLVPGEITEGEKQWLYQNGEAYLFPSLSEGFGIPVIEAFAHGKPVFCSRHGSLPEIGSSQAYYWEALSPEPMANLVRSGIAEDDAARREARKSYAAAFTWERTAEGYRKIYSSLLRTVS